MHGEGVILEVEFVEVGIEEYQKEFIESLKVRCNRSLTPDQLAIFQPVIEQARETGLPPVDLAVNLDENWDAIFSN